MHWHLRLSVSQAKVQVAGQSAVPVPCEVSFQLDIRAFSSNVKS